MRYPHLHSTELSEPPEFPAVRWSSVVSLCAAVKRRTGASSWYDRHAKRVHFGYTRPDGDIALTPLSLGLKEAATGLTCDSCDAQDEIVRLLKMGQLPASVKERWRRNADKAETHDRQEELGSTIDGSMREVEQKVDYEYRKHSMGSKHRKAALVGGRKE